MFLEKGLDVGGDVIAGRLESLFLVDDADLGLNPGGFAEGLEEGSIGVGPP